MDQNHLNNIKSRTKKVQDHKQSINPQLISRMMKYLSKESQVISHKSLVNPSFPPSKRVSRRKISLHHQIHANQISLIQNNLKKE